MTAWVLTSSILILVIAGLRQLLKGKIAPGFQYALWLLVLVRLLVPGSLTASPISVENLLPRETESRTAVLEPVHENVYWNDAATVEREALAEYQYQNAIPDSAAAAAPEPDPEPFDWERLLLGVWIAGMILSGLILLGSNLSFCLRLRRSRKRLNLELPLPVYEAEGLPSPCLFGLLKPTVYVPASYAADQQAMAHILAHERSHYRHGDHIWSLLRGVALCIHWYNPLVWLAAVLSKQDAELACDAAAIRTLGEDQRLPYGRTLLKLIASRPRPADLLTCATTMISGKRSLKQRITYIAKKPKMLTVTAILAILAAAVAVGCTFTGAETANGMTAQGATLSMTYVDAQVSLSGSDLDHLLDLYNSREITETSQPMPEAVRLTVELETEDGMETWTVTPGGICSESRRQGNYIWVNADYEALSGLFWNQIAPDRGSVINLLSSVSQPALNADQIQEAVGLFRTMVLTPTSNEPDYVNELHIGLSDGDQLLLSFFVDPKGEIVFTDSEQSYYYMCENGEAVYQRLLALMDGTAENPVKGLAWTYISEQIAALEESGYKVLDAELTGMTPLTQSTASEYGASVVEYRIKLQDPETVSLSPGMEMTEDGWLTEKGSMGQPVLLTRVIGDTERLAGVQWTRYLEMVYGEDMKLAAESEILYLSFQDGLSYDPAAKVLYLAEDNFDKSWSFQLSGMADGAYVSDYFSYADTVAENGHCLVVDLSRFETCHLEVRRDLENGESVSLGILDLLPLTPEYQPVEGLSAAWMEALGDTPGIQYVNYSGEISFAPELKVPLSTPAQLSKLRDIFSGCNWTPEHDSSTLSMGATFMIQCVSADGRQSILFQSFQGGTRAVATLNGQRQAYVTDSNISITGSLLELANEVLAEAQGDILSIDLRIPREDWGDTFVLGILSSIDTEKGLVVFDEMLWVDTPDQNSGFRLEAGLTGQTLPLAEQCQYWTLFEHYYPCLRLSPAGMQSRVPDGALYELYIQDGQVIAICQKYTP